MRYVISFALVAALLLGAIANDLKRQKENHINKPVVVTFEVNCSPEQFYQYYNTELLTPLHSAMCNQQRTAKWERKFKYIHVAIPETVGNFKWYTYHNDHAKTDGTEVKDKVFVIFTDNPIPDPKYLRPWKS